MLDRFDAGPALAALGGGVLLLSLFVGWFTPGGSAWSAFESLDVLLAGLALTALALALGRLRGPGRADGHRLLGLGALAVLAVAVQLVEPPPRLRAADPELGPWLALAGAALVLAGGLLTTARISVAVSVSDRAPRQR
ncbi:MAG: hypothetical protein M3P39_06380, partial [Actinomycetota bacterium]|nr:hypothetical protein [Actinomycetota bacterium]